MGRKHAKARSRFSAALQLQQARDMQQRGLRQEQAFSAVMGQFGRAGTYDPTGAYQETGPIDQPLHVSGRVSRAALSQLGAIGPGQPWQPGTSGDPAKEALLRQSWDKLPDIEKLQYGNSYQDYYLEKVASGPYDLANRLREQVAPQLNPAGVLQRTKASSQFQLMSRLTGEAGQRVTEAGQQIREAEDLVQRRGAAWENLQSAVIGPLKEGAAAAMEGSMAEIEQMYARGGSARNKALQQAMRIQAQASVNQRAFAQISDARLRMDAYTRQIRQAAQGGYYQARGQAVQQIAANVAFANNIAGARQSYTDTMNAVSQYMGTVAIPSAQSLQEKADMLGAKKKKNWASMAIGAGTAIVGGVLTATGIGAPLGMGMMAAGTGMMGQGAA